VSNDGSEHNQEVLAKPHSSSPGPRGPLLRASEHLSREGSSAGCASLWICTRVYVSELKSSATCADNRALLFVRRLGTLPTRHPGGFLHHLRSNAPGLVWVYPWWHCSLAANILSITHYAMAAGLGFVVYLKVSQSHEVGF
jgi:hypothetical protein